MVTFDLAPFRSLYPWEGRNFEVRPGIRMHYLDEGQGEPVVLLHGNPTWSFYWRALVSDLARTHRVVVPDHVGCGLSDKPGDGAYRYTLDSRVADFTALLDHLKLGRFTLGLHDWGGMIGLAHAVRHPQSIARLVITNTAGFGLPPGRRLPWQIGLVRHAAPMALLVRGANAFLRGALMTCTVRRLDPLVRRAYLAPHESWQTRISVQRFVEDIPLRAGDASWDTVEDTSRSLARLTQVPALLLWGRRDFVFDDHFLAEWRRRMPLAETHEFEDAGHWLMEDEAEAVVPLVRRFLERTPR